MRLRRVLQSDTALVYVVLLSSLLAGWTGVAALFGPPEANPGHSTIRQTAFSVLGFWCFGVLVGLPLPPGDVRRRMLPSTRMGYTCGLGLCLLHMAVAYHLAHGWSHAAALAHVEAASGFGPGLYVNFVFAAVWLADVVWCWASLDGYRDRPRWVSRLVVGFMAFILFNAAVVFNTPSMRVVSALVLSAPLVLWVLARRAA